uniref:Casein kinase substrate phosphoprotein PP28 n=1 Tax=Schistocephalus solidus TaxID=70667 RepID=A0A0X3Q0H1_SCHSO
MRGKGKYHKRRGHIAPSEDSQTPGVATHWRKGDEESSEEDADEVEKEEGAEEEAKEVKAKGVSHLIETKNPNRIGASRNIFDESAPMSRREREAMELANMDPLKLKSDEELARDLARLSLIRKEREEAAKKREEEKKAKEAERAAAQARAQERLAALQQKGKKKSGGGKPKTSTRTDPPVNSSATPSVPATES